MALPEFALAWFFALVGLCSCCAGAGDSISSLPLCGLTCVAQALPASSCQAASNTSCICTDNDLSSAVQKCVASTCNITDAIAVARIQAEACDSPVRSRRAGLLAPIAVEVPAAIAAFLRLFSRWYTAVSWEWDDWIMTVVAVMFLPFFVIGQYVGILSFGVDLWTVNLDTVVQGLKLFYVNESFYLTILALTKISILFFYLRIFPNAWFRAASYVVMVWVAMSSTIFLFLQIFQCVPVDSIWLAWKGDYGPHHCLAVNTLAYVAAAFSIAQDIAILVMPLPLLIGLNTTWRAKTGVLIMFSLGIFILITSCIRLHFIVMFARSMNPTWDYTDSLIWSGLEVSVSVIVTSLPAIRVLCGRILPGIISSMLGSSAGHSAGSAVGKGRGYTASPPQALYRPQLRTQRSSTSIFGIVGRALREPDKSELELGDQVKGKVQTEIGAGDRGNCSTDNHQSPRTSASDVGGTGGSSSRSAIGSSSMTQAVSPVSPGIRVHTTTTRVVGGAWLSLP